MRQKLYDRYLFCGDQAVAFSAGHLSGIACPMAKPEEYGPEQKDAVCTRKTKKARSQKASGFKRFSGNVLLSHTASHAVPPALKSLTSVFEMGTGVTSSQSSPEKFLQILLRKINSDVFVFQMLKACVNYFAAKPHDQLVPVS